MAVEVISGGGRRLGALNAIVGSHFGPPAGPGSATWREAFTTMIENMLTHGTKARPSS